MFCKALLALGISAYALIGSAHAAAECIPFSEASHHVGETKCVTGTVLRVAQGSRGVHYLDFCDDFRLCPFVAVIFASDLKHIGDVRQLKGRQIEVHGDVKLYDGRAEIVVREARQLQGEMARIPPLPKNYDVEQKGRYSAGTFSHPKAAKSSGKKRQPVTLPVELPDDTTQ